MMVPILRIEKFSSVEDGPFVRKRNDEIVRSCVVFKYLESGCGICFMVHVFWVPNTACDNQVNTYLINVERVGTVVWKDG